MKRLALIALAAFLTPALASAADFKVPTSGRYSGWSTTGWKYHMVYDKIAPGYYRVRNESGAGRGRPNPFDKGTVLSEGELLKHLVEDGQVR